LNHLAAYLDPAERDAALQAVRLIETRGFHRDRDLESLMAELP
jgi:hypothetical protein